MTLPADEKKLEKMRHTAAHVLAAASTRLKPETKLGVGPAIDNGFYHDLEVDENWGEQDLKKLQKEMEKIKRMNLPITHRQVSKLEAKKLFAHDPYKLELIDKITDDSVGVSDMGDGFFVTLCRGGHVETTNDIGHFQLTRLAGVYWQGDANNKQLQRIYGVLFATKEELQEHLALLVEAKKRDHRKLGKQLDLFTFSKLIGPGLPLFTPRGTIIREQLEQFLYSIQEPLGYQRVNIPHLTKPALYETSGHLDKFGENLFHVKGRNNEAFVVKPMNCPHHTQIYASRPRSHKDLPLRYAEITKVYRDEQAGELLGLARVRSITQDDAHIFCRPDQIKTQVSEVIAIVQRFYAVFNWQLQASLSVRDQQKLPLYLGSEKIWSEAEGQLKTALTDNNIEFAIDEGGAVFYGPKIDFTAIDSLQRKWQLATVQLDFNMPQRFQLTYTGPDGNSETPVIIHRAIMGSLERFMAILLEHYAGALPLWLSPTQVAILPITDVQQGYAQELAANFNQAGIRVEVNSQTESIGKKIREAELMKVPVMLIVGPKEVETKTVAVRSRVLEADQNANSKEIISTLCQRIKDRL